MGFTSFFANFVQIAVLMVSWLLVLIAFRADMPEEGRVAREKKGEVVTPSRGEAVVFLESL